jgi:predicted outer membrane repeat protein
VTFQGFTIQNGVAFDPNSPDGPTSSGGGIRDQGIASLTLNNVVVTHNTASADGGGVSMENTVSAPWTLTVNNSVISDNGAGDAGGGLETDGLGTVLVSDSTITGNTCVNQGAGIWLDAVENGNTFESATLTVTGSVVSDNQALAAMNGNLFNDGGGIGNAGNDTNFAGTVTGVNIINSTVENNSSAGVGGGFGDQNNQDILNVQNSLFLNNTSGNGGGGIYFSGATVTINNSELQGNSTGGAGGGLFLGGPVTSSGTPVGTTASVLTLTNSTLAGNTAGTNGGGIELETTGTGSIIRNVTITGNRALNNAGANGGGIDAPDTFTGGVTLDSDTINANFGTIGGGIFWGSEAHSTFAVQNTIVALNTALNGADVDSGLSLTDNGGNLTGNIATALFTRSATIDPLLGPLQDNGGQLAGAPGAQQVVQTEALLAGSPAIGTGVATGAPTTDERGFNRVNGRIDIGAFEFQALTSALTLTASPSLALFGQPVTFTATVSSQTPGTNAVPTGTVTFTIDGVPQAPVTLNNGVATLTLPSLAAGAHTVTAAYGGDSNFTTSTASVTEMVQGLRDVTGLVKVTLVKRHKGHNNTLTETLMLTNMSGAPITGPVYTVLDGLMGAMLKNATGHSQTHVTPGDPFVLVSMGDLGAGQSQMVNLLFATGKKGQVNFNTFVLAGPGVV